MASFVINTVAQVAPPVEWRSYSYIANEYNSATVVDRRHSDYDWFYDHCTAYDDVNTKTSANGYIACGIGKYRNPKRLNPSAATFIHDETTSAYGIYNNGCTNVSIDLFATNVCYYDFGNFENKISGKTGIGFNQTAKINPDGTTQFVLPMNFAGEYFSVRQIHDNNFITVGVTASTRKRTTPPQNGTPLYYNPSATNPTDYFINNQIFNVQRPQANSSKMDIMKFDKDGTCLFNGLYGMYNFNDTGTFNILINSVLYTINGKQRSYYSNSTALSLCEDVNKNIIAVGNSGYLLNTTGQFKIVASLVKLDSNGKVLGKMFIDPPTTGAHESIAKAVEYAVINGIGYYIVGVSEGPQFGGGTAITKIYAIKEDLSTTTLLRTFNSSTIPGQQQAQIFDFTIKNNFLYIPLLANANQLWWAGNGAAGELHIVKMDLNAFNNTATNLVFDNNLTTVQAFDLKARITQLSNGDFAIVSSKVVNSWTSLGCSPPPPYILGTAHGCPNNGAGNYLTYWNSDTYVAKVNDAGSLIWSTTFDGDDPFTCTDYPTSPSSGNGDVKRQECMYGVSESPDKGIILSGNASPNLDDNYMAKLFSDCDVQQSYTITAPITTISSNITWSTNQRIKGIIKLVAGGTLNITGATTVIEFADSKRVGTPSHIEVYPGAKLIINGATLTANNACDNSMWTGIKMFGNVTLSQTPANQPYLTLINATIANAHIGIQNGIRESLSKMQSGGVIDATGTLFSNNFIDAQFLPYRAPFVSALEPDNKSKFKYCTFKATNFLKDYKYGNQIAEQRMVNFAHVMLNNVKGINFTGNTFKTDLPSTIIDANVNNRSYGIYSTDATFKVEALCNSFTSNGNCNGYTAQNTFDNLLYGVYAEAANPLNTFSITNTNFINCNGSIYQSGINFSEVNKNNFSINKVLPIANGAVCFFPNCNNFFYYLNNSTGYSHQENVYTVAPSMADNVVATVFNASGTAANLSYRNQ